MRGLACPSSRPTSRPSSPTFPGSPSRRWSASTASPRRRQARLQRDALGPLARALAGRRHRRASVHLYPDGSAYFLKEAIARKFGVPTPRSSSGTDRTSSSSSWSAPSSWTEREVLTSAQSFAPTSSPPTPTAARSSRCPCASASTTTSTRSAARLSPRTKVVFLATPTTRPARGSWSGTSSPSSRRCGDGARRPRRGLRGVRGRPGSRTRCPLRSAFANLVSWRTFSKILRARGLRLGYLFARPEGRFWTASARLST